MTPIQDRLAAVRRLMKEEKLPALLVSQPENRRYLSGFTGSAGWLLITPKQALIATDFRYWEQAERQSPELTLFKIRGRFVDFLPGLIEAAGRPRRIGYEAANVTVDQLEQMKTAAPTVRWLKAGGLIEELREVKDADEIAQTRVAIELAEAAFKDVTSRLKPGMTEAQIAWELEVHMRTHGASGLAFDTIVASGPNAALPHHGAGDRPIREGEPITIDWGAVVNGYRSDLTRTIVLGEPDAKFNEVYGVVLKAQLNTIEHLHAGLTSKQADALARDVIAAAGYGDNFGHGLGHGVGLATHEGPRATWLLDDVIPAGSILTVEPGIYLPGWGGVRIEDMVLVREDGVEVLSYLEK